MKKCSSCDLVLEDSYFSKYRSKCKGCRVKYSQFNLKNRLTKMSVDRQPLHVLTCLQCQEQKSVNLFHKNKLSNTGYHSRCGQCINGNAQIKKYGVTKDFLISMSWIHKNACLICKTPQTCWVIDHCHGTGKVRGLLCNNCNLGLGLFKDNPDALKAAADYVTFYRERNLRSAGD